MKLFSIRSVHHREHKTNPGGHQGGNLPELRRRSPPTRNERTERAAFDLLLFRSCLTEGVCNPSLYAAAVSIPVNLGRDDESEPEPDGDADNTDYDPEGPAKNFSESKE
jgi:hypothetical protein